MVYVLPNASIDTGLDGALAYISGQVPELFSGILFLIFFMITIIGYQIDKRTSGKENMLAWLSIGSFITTTLGIVLYLIPGLINLTTVIIMIAITFAFTFFFLLSNND